MRIKSYFVPLTLFFLGALMANMPLFLRGTLYGSEDLWAYFQWSREFSQAIRDGVYLPRWDSSGMEGLGAPSFIFYPPAFFYLVALLELIGLDTWSAMRLIVFLCWWALGFVGWAYLRTYTNEKWSLAGGLALQWNPFLFHAVSLQNLFPFAVTALPIIWFVFASLQQPHKINLSVVFSLALLVFTHQLVAFIALVSLPALFLPALLFRTSKAVPSLFWWCVSCGLGLLLSSWHLVTAMTSLDLIQTDDWFEPFHCDWRNSFITPLVTAAVYGSRWFGIQWGIGGLALLFLICSLLLLWRFRRRFSSDAVYVQLSAASVVAFFWAFEGSYLVWRYAPLIGMVQWPYRFLMILLPLLIILLVCFTSEIRSLRAQGVIAMLLILIPVLSFALQVRNLHTLSAPDFGRMNTVKYYSRPADLGEHWKRYLEADGFRGECARQGVHVLSQTGHSERYSWELHSDAPCVLRLPLMSFPAWKLTINGVSVDVQTDLDTGLITCSLPEGESRIDVSWQRLPQERLGAAMSLTGLLAVLFIVGWRRIPSRTPLSP